MGGKVIARIMGGVGNQLFCYAAARRLALKNGAELVLDHVSGFSRDSYRRSYMLDRFSLPVRTATAAERLEPLERYRRGLAKYLSRKRPFLERRYLEQEGIEFDPRLLSYRLDADTLYLEGLWQSERYFEDVGDLIRSDLQLLPPSDRINTETADMIAATESVCLHVRWFDPAGSASGHNLKNDYYLKAVRHLEERVTKPHYFLFSDDPEAASAKLRLPSGRCTTVSHNRGDRGAGADLWLMSRCRHMITANSTFSWWGAWLGERDGKVVITPGARSFGTATAWGFEGLLPERWIKL